jgi:hypothetical protein
MTVYTFKIFYDFTDDVAQERYVVAESEESAWKKITAHFEKLYSEGFALPVFIADPTVELGYVII